MRPSKKKYVCAHLLNDYSGSPNVLKQLITVLQEEGVEVDIYTSKGTEGFLSNLKDVNYHLIPYQHSNNKLITLINYLKFQLVLMVKIFFNHRKEEDLTILINTIHPFGAALAGKLIGKPVIYYIHETLIRPELLKKFLFYIVKVASSLNLYVSNYLKQKEGVQSGRNVVVYNTLEKSFWNENCRSQKADHEPFNVVFLGSNKAYKGVDTFLQLAEKLREEPGLVFTMKLNAPVYEVDELKQKYKGFTNLSILDKRGSVHEVYQSASLVMNLSKPHSWIETFGLTLLEGFTYGVPAISPNIGGPLEIVDHGKNGYCLDVEHVDDLASHILKLKNDKELYSTLSEQALKKAQQFSFENYRNNILKTLGV